MAPEIILSILLPFLGTALGSAGVFFLRNPSGRGMQRCLSGFAAGVMTAASVWSLILPALERSRGLDVPVFFPALVGIWAGFLFLGILDRITCRIMPGTGSTMLLFAVALHNLPEGMAVGAAIVGHLNGGAISAPAVLALALGIAIQNLPEGAIISLPLGSRGTGRCSAFGWGVLSGVIEPIGAALTIVLAELALPVLPYLLSFSAGAMLYVVVEELIPEGSDTLYFAAGFTLMMVLDVALG